MDKFIIDDKVIHKCFEIINKLSKEYPWEIQLQNSADTLGVNVRDLERAINNSKLYELDDLTKKYTLVK